MLDYKRICSDTKVAAQEAGDYIMQSLTKVTQDDIVIKDKNSLVSYVDQEAERILVSRLSKILPDATFITEEETIKNATSDLEWIIDPLDGTTNFLHQLPVFAVSIALRYQGTIVVGVIYIPKLQEMFYSWKDGGAWLNGDQIFVSTNTDFSQALIATGFPYRYFDFMEYYISSFKVLLKQCRGIRRMGAAAVDLAYVACGRFDAYFEYRLNIWDIAAGILLVKEAGGVLSDFEGGNNYLTGKEVFASSKHCVSPLRSIIASRPVEKPAS